MAFTRKIQPYAVIEVPVSATADLPQGAIPLRGGDVSPWKANTLTVLDIGTGGDLSFKLNDSDNDSIIASNGLKIEGNTFREIYWTNTVVIAKVYLAWVD